MSFNLKVYKHDKETNGECLVILIHGLGAPDTWVKTKSNWPETVNKDIEYKGIDFAVATFKTAHLSSYDSGIIGKIVRMCVKLPIINRKVSINLGFFSQIVELARELKREIDLQNQYDKIILVGHSMGGLIAIRYILEQLRCNHPLKVVGCITIAAPFHGSIVAFDLGRAFKCLTTCNRQISDLEPNSEFITETIRMWNSFLSSPAFQKIHFAFCYGKEDGIVPKGSAIPVFEQEWDGIPLSGDHRTVTNCDNSINSTVYRTIKNNIMKSLDKHKSQQNIVGPVSSQHEFSSSSTAPRMAGINSTQQFPGFFSIGSSEETLIEKVSTLYEAQINNLMKRRNQGDFNGAKRDLEKILSVETNNMSPKVAARYYLMSATWLLIDEPDSENIELHYNKAIEVYPELDTRAFRAKMAAIKGDYQAALNILTPLDKEVIINAVLELLIASGQGCDAERYLDQYSFPLKDTTHHLLSLCFLQELNFIQAEKENKIALSAIPNSPIYLFAAGIIAYYEGLPADLRTKNLVTCWYEPGILNPSNAQLLSFQTALEYFCDARRQAEAFGASPMSRMIRDVWISTAEILPCHRELARREALKILAEERCNESIIRYILSNNIKGIDEIDFTPLFDLINDGKATSGQIYAAALLLINQKKYDNAVLLLNKWERECKEDSSWIAIKVHALTLGEKYDDAREVLCKKSVDEATSYRLNLFISIHENEENRAIELARIAAENYGTRLDIRNRAIVSRQFKNWGETLKATQVWIESFPDALAFELHIEALYSLKKWQDCLNAIANYEETITNDMGAIRVRYFKMESNYKLGRFFDSLKVANELWKNERDEDLLIKRARLNLSLGDKPKAIIILKDGIEEDRIISEQILGNLSQLLIQENPGEAFLYAEKLLDLYPDNPQVYMFLINIGFRTGHDKDVTPILTEFNKKYPQSELLQRKTFADIVEMSKKYQEESRWRWEKWAEGEFLLHAILDMDNTPLSIDFNWRWYGNERAAYEQIPFPIVYGGRVDDKLTEKSSAIFLDYSACLTAHALDIFPALEVCFSTFIVAPSLMLVIEKELELLAPNQPHRYEEQKKVLDYIEKLPIKILQATVDKDVLEKGLEYSDAVKWKLAEENNALIVTDSFVGDMVNEAGVPEELRQLQVTTGEMVTWLIDSGFVASGVNDTYPHMGIIRPDVVEKLTSGMSLIIDTPFFEWSIKLALIADLTDHFNIVIPQYTVDTIKGQLHMWERKLEVKNWLKRLLNKLGDLHKKRKLVFGPLPEMDEADINANESLGVLIREALYFAKEDNMGTSIWFDDRYINSYSQCEKSRLVNVFDIIDILHDNNAIGIREYRNKLYALYKSNVQFYVPSISYVLEALIDAKQRQGVLVENEDLRVIRKYIARALDNNSLIGKKKLPHNAISEATGFSMRLHLNFYTLLIRVWSCKGKDEQWQRAAANWLLAYCSDYLGEQPRLIQTSLSVNELLSIKHAELIIRGFQMMLKNQDNKYISKGYFSWLFQRLGAHWFYNPSLRTVILKKVVDFLAGQLTNENNTWLSHKNEIRNFHYQFLQALPFDVKQECITLFSVYSFFSETCKKVVIIGDDLEIPEDIWTKWIERALDKGENEESHENYGGREIKIKFQGTGVSDQQICIKYKNNSGNLEMVAFFDPCIQLRSLNADIRNKWFADVAKYVRHECLPLNKNIVELLSEAKVDSIKEMLAVSPDYFFDRLKTAISTSARLPDMKILFPNSPNLYFNLIPEIPLVEDREGVTWFCVCSQLVLDQGFEKALSTLAACPFGGSWSFSIMVERMVESGQVEKKVVLDWALGCLSETVNPVKQQNLISLMLANLNHLSSSKEIILTKITTLLDSGWSKDNECKLMNNIFLELQKTGWRFMETEAVFRQYSDRHRILWSYLYADRSISMYAKNMPASHERVLRIIELFNKRLAGQIDPITLMTENHKEVTCPISCSTWRIVFGGIIGVIESEDSTWLKDHLLSKLLEISTGIMDNKYDFNGMWESFYLFDGALENSFQSRFARNNILALNNLIKLWGGDIQDFNPAENIAAMLKEPFEKSELPLNILAFLCVCSNYSLPNNILELIREILNKFSIPETITGDKLWQQGLAIVSAINSLPEEAREQLQQKYIKDFGCRLKSYPDEWRTLLGLLWHLMNSGDVGSSARNFIKGLSDIVDSEFKEKSSNELLQYVSILPYQVPFDCYVDACELRRKVSGI